MLDLTLANLKAALDVVFESQDIDARVDVEDRDGDPVLSVNYHAIDVYLEERDVPAIVPRTAPHFVAYILAPMHCADRWEPPCDDVKEIGVWRTVLDAAVGIVAWMIQQDLERVAEAWAIDHENAA